MSEPTGMFFTKVILFMDGMNGAAMQYHQIFHLPDETEEGRELTEEEMAAATPTDVYVVWERSSVDDQGTRTFIRGIAPDSGLGPPRAIKDVESSADALNEWWEANHG